MVSFPLTIISLSINQIIFMINHLVCKMSKKKQSKTHSSSPVINDKE